MAQSLVVCQFCEVSNDIKWKCINCDLILCEDCNTKIHTKIKSSDKHTVADLKAINDRTVSETVRTLELHNIPCTDHADEKCIIYCQDCKTLICCVCLINSHTNHKLDKIHAAYKDKVQELKDWEEKINEVYPLYCKKEEEIAKVKAENLEKYKQIKQTIHKREGEIKEAASKQAETLINNLNSIWKPQEELLSKSFKEIQENKEKLSKQKAQIEDTFLSYDAVSVFNINKTTSKNITPPNEMPLLKDIILLKSNTIPAGINIGSIIPMPKLNIEKTYSTELPNIFKIKMLSDETIITASVDQEDLCKIKIEDENLLSSHLVIHDCDVVDMTLTDDEKLLFSTFNNSEVKSLDNFGTNSKSEIFLSISPLHVRGLHASNKNIYIGFIDDGLYFPLTKKSRRGIMVYDYDCRHMRTIEYDTNNERIFSLPEAITTSDNGNICVLDSTSNENWEGRVVVLTALGKVKWIYNGDPSINKTSKFTPIDILYFNEFLFVTDKDGDALHVLSMEGNLVASLTKTDGIERPFSIDENKKGQFLIGSGSIPSKENKAKLFIVKLTCM